MDKEILMCDTQHYLRILHESYVLILLISHRAGKFKKRKTPLEGFPCRHLNAGHYQHY